MRPETLLLWAALAAYAGTLLLGFWRPRSWLPQHRERVAHRSFQIGTGAATVALAVLTFHFLTANLGIRYVFTYTRTTYAWYYRLAGVWGGQEGTLLMWAAFGGLLGLAYLTRAQRAIDDARFPADAQRTVRASRNALATIQIILVGATIIGKVFEATDAYFLQFRPLGNGLQAVLLTPFMIIHPPLQFVAYALAGVMFSAGLASVATGQRHWAGFIHPWVRVAVLFATIGLGLGGLWAYYVLNFGGFWAWDPVETANLIAWFPPLLLLHALLRYDQGHYSTAAPLFALLTLPTALFATVSTRTGLWVSVHAFTDPSQNFARDPLVRLLNILETSAMLQYLSAFFLASFLLGLTAIAWGRTRNQDSRLRAATRTTTMGALAFTGAWLVLDPVPALSLLFEASHAITFGRNAALGLFLLAFATVAAVALTGNQHTTDPGPPPMNEWVRRILRPRPRHLLTAGITLLGLALLVTFLIDVATVNGFDRRLYDDRAPLIALPIFLVMGRLFLQPRHGDRDANMLVAGALILGAGLALAAPDHWHLAITLPALGLALWGSIERLLHFSQVGGVADGRDRTTGALLVFAGLLSMVYWANPPSRIEFGVLSVEPHWAWAVPLYGLSLFALFAGALHRGRPRTGFSRAGAFAAILTLGPYGASGILALVALLRLRATDKAPGPLRVHVRHRHHALRKSAVYLIHVGLLLGLAGYGFATFETTQYEPVRIGAGEMERVGPYVFSLVDSYGVGWDPEQRLPQEVHARLAVWKGGTFLQETNLVFWLVPDDTQGHYDARATLIRTPTEDVYLVPVALTTPFAVLEDHVHGARPEPEPEVLHVDVAAKRLPGMNLVWFGLWTIGTGVLGVLLMGGWGIAPTRHSAELDRAANQTNSSDS